MIVYEPLWITMKERNISQYRLIHYYAFSTGLLDRLRKNQPTSTYTIDRLCSILNCGVEQIIKYVPDKEEAV